MEQETKTFEWMIEHQEVFDALKEALCTAPVLGYPISAGNLYWRLMPH